ncbi:hypothetical protein COCON_G00216650 [Conger conger]|uniref:PH domain-containing protein n=1 Tax=Conger conger TaxID=82655 RepID=A0A9Q1CXZ5_CONCO|nr:hypothetical protein COCON_G00216650 [Conger conger]
MEDGVKGTTPSFTGKAGWVKKSSGKLLGSYKERYIKVEKTEMVVFENQELQTCLERVDLEKYDKCLDLRSTFKKKNRLVLIRAHKQGSKVHDVKLQVENAEEKEVWIKALNDAINRAKNKIFDEVKVDESCSLDHVTRSRPRGTQSRRPPSRIHMKEVASSSCDGIVRLDLHPVEHTPNGTHELNAATVEVSDKKSEPIAKPPMPPSQPSEDLQDTPSEERMANPTPPLKESKPKDESGQPTPEREHSEHKVLSEQEVVSPVLNAEPPASYRTEVQFVIGPVQLLDWAGRPPLSIPTPVGELLSAGEEQQPDVDELRSRVAHELQTTQELLGEVCQEEGRGPVPEDLLIKAAEKLQLAQLCLREASTLKLCQPSSRKDKRISW